MRLAGCNLRCAWCDSEYTFSGGKPFTQDEIVAADRGAGSLQADGVYRRRADAAGARASAADGASAGAGYTLMIETSGERPLADVPKAVHKIVDVKCPGAGAAANSFRMENLDALTKNDEVKFVISDRADYEFARDFIREHALEQKAGADPALASISEDAEPAERPLTTWRSTRASWSTGCSPTACLRG